MTSGDWNFPTRIRIGPGRIGELAAACRESGIERPLLVTDTGLAASALLAAADAILGRDLRGHVVFAEVNPDPTESDLDRGVAALIHHTCDGVVALGGGSALDAGKLIAFMAGQSRSVWEFEDGDDRWKLADPGAIRPVVAIPTTAGTGSEVGRASVITDPTQTKRVIFHPLMMPASVICDPELTTGLPRHLTAGTGMDALSHALEAYCSPVYHPAADAIAAEAIRLVLEHLPVAADRPFDLEARQQMLTAALMGATAFQKGLGAMHAISHPVGAHFGTHHGTTNAVMMPYVLVANRPAIEERIDRLCALLGRPDGFDGFLATVVRLRDELGLPHTLAELGVSAAATEVIADAAIRDPSASTNPVEITREFAEALIHAALTGTLDAPAPIPATSAEPV